MDNAKQVSQSRFAEFSAAAYDLKPVIAEHGIAPGFMKSISQIEILSADPLCIIPGGFVDHFEIQNKLQTRIDLQQLLYCRTSIAP